MGPLNLIWIIKYIWRKKKSQTRTRFLKCHRWCVRFYAFAYSHKNGIKVLKEHNFYMQKHMNVFFYIFMCIILWYWWLLTTTTAKSNFNDAKAGKHKKLDDDDDLAEFL